ncbi:ABC transporter permease [Paenibacillus arenilitoris]|uniref:Sugar ABC transporter permease n=1 Tax=Paenibacillus arenilitoris TaxID=2772299 RepID=A0A927H8G8_9BACL|nr:ABC transporter permease subunit [Paenibacillus arenilitoris]MBD2870604.1 sugar ABC transporter permease [Paenibacillus arenilitoris]
MEQAVHEKLRDSSKRSKHSVWREYKKYRGLLLLLLPGIVFYSVFHYAPLYGIQLAFKEFRIMDGIAGSPWVGFKHFNTMFFVSNQFGTILKNTLIISFLHIVFGFPAPIVLALLFNEIRLKVFKRVTQSISYLPHFLSWIILAGLLTTILSPSTGIVNQLIASLGFEPIYFLGDPNYFRFTLVVSGIWKEIGWGTIIYLAALASVDPHLYEAAVVDGANRWRQTLSITIPCLLPVISIMLLLRIGGILDAGFDQILNLYNPAVLKVSDILDTYVYRVGIGQFQYGLTTAVGLFKNVVGFMMILFANYAIKKMGQEGLF